MPRWTPFFAAELSPERRIGVLSKIPLAAAILGRADAVSILIPNQIDTKESPILANRMDLREGEQTTNVQRLGNAADALHTALCQDLPPAPGKLPVIRVFPAWPKLWDAEFTLLCRGGFLVASAMHKGQIEFVEINSQVGGACRMRNPWGETEVMLYRDGIKSENMKGSLLNFATRKGENILAIPTGTTPDQFKQTVLAKSDP